MTEYENAKKLDETGKIIINILNDYVLSDGDNIDRAINLMTLITFIEYKIINSIIKEECFDRKLDMADKIAEHVKNQLHKRGKNIGHIKKDV